MKPKIIPQIKIQISKRTLYTIITFSILIILCFGVYAGAGTIPNPGHSLRELQHCAEKQTLVFKSGIWRCEKFNWEQISGGIKTNDFIGIGEGVGHYDDKIKLSIKGAIQLNVFTSFKTAPKCNSRTRGTIILVTTWDSFPRDKMYACLYNKNDYEYIRI